MTLYPTSLHDYPKKAASGYDAAMGHKIDLRPSGHVFELEGADSLLRAGLREGLNLSYQCANGTCGQCLARLLEGQTMPIRAHDYRLTAAQQSQGWFLLCCHTAQTDLVIETQEADQASEIPEQRIDAKVARLQLLSPDVMELTVRTPRSRSLRFLAGQNVLLQFDRIDSKSLPIASCPCDGLQLRFHVSRRHDSFSNLVFNRLKRGHSLTLLGPIGDFVLDEQSARPLLMVAWKSGFAPIASLIDHAIQSQPERRIALYWLADNPQGHYQENACRAWRDALDHFSYQLITLDSAQSAQIETVLQVLLTAGQPIHDWDGFLALPASLQRSLGDGLVAAGLPAAQLHLTSIEDV